MAISVHDHSKHLVTISGFVPVQGLAGYDYSYGRAYGFDLVGPFNQHTGPYGPFGFWANLYHDKK